ncbi:MAG TPA: zinc ribbon domain-containing protein [Methylothermaceae bacterium]|nr:zinc ribbon domain-containing protein [Methylothermaceae bacterium]
MQVWYKPLQSLVAIFFTWIVGSLVAGSDTFATTSLARGLSLADLAMFLTQLITLVLLLILVRQVQTALPENGRIASFLRALLPPLATLITLLLGQNLVLDMAEPFLSLSGERILVLLFWLAILASAGWLVWTSYNHAPELVAGLLALGGKLERWPHKLHTCPSCGAHLKDQGSFCGYCGASLTPSPAGPSSGSDFDKTRGGR